EATSGAGNLLTERLLYGGKRDWSTAMRSTWVLAVAGVIYGAVALAGDSPPPAGKVVYLYTTAQLEQLRKDNPKHYAQAERILAAGSKLCAPGADSLIQIGLNVHDLQC